MNKWKLKTMNLLHSFMFTNPMKKQLLSILLITLFIFSMSFDVSHAKDIGQAWSELVAEYRVIVAGITGFGAVTSVLIFIYHFIKLGAVADNPWERREVMKNILISGICTALLGGISLILVLFVGTMLDPNIH